MNLGGLLSLAGALMWIGLIGLLFWRLKRRRGHIGPAAAGTMYDLLQQDRRKAVEIIIEEKTAARDPEDADGDLPQLEDPTGKRHKVPRREVR